MNDTKPWLRWLSVLAAGACCAAGALASSSVRVTARDVTAAKSVADEAAGSNGQSLAVFASMNAQTNLPGTAASSNSNARASEGSLGVYSFATAFATQRLTGGAYMRMDASASASFNDRIWFIPITLGPLDVYYRIEATMILNGAMNAVAFGGSTAANNAWANTYVEVKGSGMTGDTGQIANFTQQNLSDTDNPIDRVYGISLIVVPRSETYISYNLHTLSIAVAEVGRGAGSAISDATAFSSFENTLLWGGISKVFDSRGNVVADYEITSASGFDYRNAVPVPEPGGWMFLAGGLIAMCWVRRRRGVEKKHCANVMIEANPQP